jgi:hypothetical protein
VKIIRNVFIIFFLVFFALPNHLLAQTGNIRIGNLTITPSLTGQAIYDSNIYLKNGSDEAVNKKESDWIYHLMPGIMLNYMIPERGQIKLGYQGDWAFYDKNSNNDWDSQKVIFGADYNAPGGLILGISNLWQNTKDPYGSADQYALGRATQRWTDELRSKAGYNFADVFKVLLLYNFFKQEYKDQLDFNQNYDNNEFGLGLETRIFSRTWGFVRYHYGQRNYNSFYFGLSPETNSDFTYHRASAGLTWDPTAKINGELNFGYMWKKYKNEFDQTNSMRENNNTWVAATSITYKPLTTTSITLNIDRALRDSNANTSEYFEDTGFGINLQQTILSKLVLSVGGQYSYNKYNLPVANNRKDNNYSANVGLDYNIRQWLTIGPAYNYMRKDSNIEVNSFTDHRALLTMKVSY